MEPLDGNLMFSLEVHPQEDAKNSDVVVFNSELLDQYITYRKRNAEKNAFQVIQISVCRKKNMLTKIFSY